MLKRKSMLKTLLTIVAAGTVAGGTYAMTAGNTLPTSPRVGQGSTTINGYSISSVTYTLNASSPQNLDAVAFTINPTAASSAKVRLNGTTWYNCASINTSTGAVSCDTTVGTQATAAGATALEVVVAE